MTISKELMMVQGSTALLLLKQGLHRPNQVCMLPFADQAGTLRQDIGFVTAAPLTV